MQRLIFILTITLLLSACSSTRRTQKNIIQGEGILTIEKIERKNLTKRSFYIQKADIRITTDESSNSLIASLKYSNEGIGLASIRSKSGIEILRVFVSRDTILANDRIHKRLFYGSASSLNRKYGVSMNNLPLLFGDIVINDAEKNEELKCSKENQSTVIASSERNIVQIVDCKAGKVKESEIRENTGENLIRVLYKDFAKAGDVVYPENIIIKDGKGTLIEIGIRKISMDLFDTIVFKSGTGYEKVLIK